MTPSHKINLNQLIPNKAALARALGLTPNTVYRWVAHNALPPDRTMPVSRILNIKPERLMQFAQQTRTHSITRQKRFKDLEVLLAAYRNEAHVPTSTLTAHAIRVTLGHWKERLPLMVETLKEVKMGVITREAAAHRLGITYSTVKQLVTRYDAIPPRVEKPLTRVQRNRELAPDAVSDVISGRRSAVAAAQHYNMNLRSLHRKIKAALAPHSINEITHWSRNFRAALAWEIAHDAPREAAEWYRRHPNLPKKPKWPGVPADLRAAPVRLLLILVLIGELDIEQLIARRGGSEPVWHGIFHRELANFDIIEPQSAHHQAAAAEILLKSLENPAK